MTQERFKRKLAAILSADVEGYSRLMDDDEEATVRTLTAYRIAIAELVQGFRGRVVDAPGDNILAEFSSVVDAVNCAVEIQRDLAERNAELEYKRKMEFRIGVNLGDVIEEDGRIYGDGVNIAARLESLAEAGGICISGKAYDEVANKLEFGYEDLGKHQVKNISTPIPVYRVLSHPGAAAHRVVKAKETTKRKWRKTALIAAVVVLIVAVLGIWRFYLRRPAVEPASVDKMAFALPDKPSIAVLAFDNLTGDPSQEYFSDGIAEEIITSLSKVGELFVIARNSSFSYKGEPVKIQQVSEELGIRYVLEGSVRKSGDKYRITAQLIDAVKGQHLWAESYDRDSQDIFDVQDEITMNIVTGLRIKLTEGEDARLWHKKYNNPEINYKIMQAISLGREGTHESRERRSQLAREISEAAPDLAIGYRLLGWDHLNMARGGISPRENIKKAFGFAQKALSLDETDGMSHSLMGWLFLMIRQYDKAIASGRRSVELYPNGAIVNASLGRTLCNAGQLDEGITYIRKGMRLNPFPAYWYYVHLGQCYAQKGRWEDALIEMEKAHQRAPKAPEVHANLAIGYSVLGRQKEARASAVKCLELAPQISVSVVSKINTVKNKAYLEIVLDAMRQAGFPE